MSVASVSKPTIVISVAANLNRSDWDQLFYGLEEEGIPCSLQQEVGAIVARAYRAAQQSALAVGIAIDADQAVVHCVNLPSQQPLLQWQRGQDGPQGLRNIGGNAARIVKGLPLRLDGIERGNWQ